MITIEAVLQLSSSQAEDAPAELTTLTLLDAVVASAFTGSPWEELARRLVKRALSDLERSIQNGTIYQRCRRARFGIPRHAELQRSPMAEDIAAEAVEECLIRFRDVALPRGEWDPGRGTSLEDFFTVCCLPHVANRWRWHLRQLPPRAVDLDALDSTGLARVLVVMHDPPAEPLAIVELRDDGIAALGTMGVDDRRSFILRSQGWSGAEIARQLGINPNALAARMSRARRVAWKRRTM